MRDIKEASEGENNEKDESGKDAIHKDREDVEEYSLMMETRKVMIC